MGEHARIGPSSLARVRRCPGSVNATTHLPRSASPAAAEGTVLHEIAAECLEFGFEPWDYAGREMSADGFDFEIGYGDGQVDPDCMVDALEWIREQPGELFIEQRIGLDPWMPGQFGTLDLGIYTPAVLTVLDFKFGYVLVELQGNEQLKAYAIGFVKLLRERGYKIPKRVRMMIEQPRPTNGHRYFEPWEISIDELMEFTTELQQIWAAANDPDAPRVAGLKQCHFCEAKDQPGGCAEHSEFMLALASQKFEDTDDPETPPKLPPTREITPERRTYIIRHASMFRQWLDALAEQALEDGLAGEPTPGMKVIDGPDGNRAWRDPEAAEAALLEFLGEQAFNKKLKSPPQAEKLLAPTKREKRDPEAWAQIQELIHRPPGKPALVPEEDPRQARLTADEKFTEED